MKSGEFVKKALFDDKEKGVAEDIWLNYFNRYLFEIGTINEKEYKKMTELITMRKTKFSYNKI